jgi:carboxylate-amine ligase
MSLNFKHNEKSLTLGVEMEIQLLDHETLLLTPRAEEILMLIKSNKLVKEMFRSTLEVITDICSDAHEVGRDLKEVMRVVRKAGEKTGMRFAGTGTNPMADYNDRILSRSVRYHQLLERNQWLIKRMAVYGLHIHIGMKNGDDCIRFNNFFLHFVPHLIALSASSPYWNCHDTGLDASRPTIYEAHPTSGLPNTVYNWSEFNMLYEKLIATQSIESMKDIWWDIRPSPGYGTLELRICDGPATMIELQSIVAFIHLLAMWFDDNRHHFYKNNKIIPEQWIMRENKWRAIRYGLQAEIISHETLEPKNLADQILFWVKKLEPYAIRMNYQPFMECIAKILKYGNSSTRQRKVMHQHNDIKRVVEWNVHEFEAGKPIWN